MQLSPRWGGDFTEPLPPFSTFAAVIAFPCAPRWTNELRKYSGNSEGFWALCNVSTLASEKGAGSADVQVGDVCYSTLRREITGSDCPLLAMYWAGKPYNPWPLCGVNIQFWAGLCHSISHPCFCASQEYSFPGRAGPSTKGQGLEWTAHILFLVQKAGDDKPILFAWEMQKSEMTMRS